ncbi:MAG: acyl carrier protein [Proteobacteria bacterium]|nr:MAG: acyl carrier protein [Pseudomonadota bacterium]
MNDSTSVSTSKSTSETSTASVFTAVASPALINQVNDLMVSGFELDREKLVPSARLKDDLSLDSLDAVDMLVHIEEQLDLKVDGEKIRALRTLSDVYSLAADAMENKAK